MINISYDVIYIIVFMAMLHVILLSHWKYRSYRIHKYMKDELNKVNKFHDSLY